jgi:cysteine desulfurase
MMKPIYLDNNATTRVDPLVMEAMLPFFTEFFGNPSSTHAFGAGVAKALKLAREQVQALLGAERDQEIVFTSGATESNNTAIRSALAASPERREIITSTVEHPAVLSFCDWLEKYEGVKVHRIPVDTLGRLDLKAYRAALSDRVAVVSIMWANNETGVIFPVEELALMAKAVGALYHCDAVQAVGKLPVALKESAIDMLSLSAHKLHGPKGVGVLYVKRGVPFQPLLRGGHQERGRRAGTENAPGAIGFGRAAALALAHFEEANSRIRMLRNRLEAGLLTIPGAQLLGDPDSRLPNTCNVAFEYLESEEILHALNKEGIAASSGSACASGSMEPSHVLRAMNIPFTSIHGAIRFSLSRETTTEEIDRVLTLVPGVIGRLREHIFALTA